MKGSSFLTLNARKVFNRLWQVFIKALIFQHFDLEYYLWLKIDTLSYAINGVLSPLTIETSFDGVVTKINLRQ